MLNKYAIAVLVFIVACSNNVNDKYYQQVAAFRIELNEKFFNPETTPLDSTRFANFKGLKFYPLNKKYKVLAKVEPITNAPIFELPHSHQKTKPYKNYAMLHFSLLGSKQSLIVLEQVNKKPGYENVLLIPFTDLTNGQSTYNGGRYIEILKPDTNFLELDFNLCFNPYCAYNDKYTCPIPPKENHLPIKVEAGMKYENSY